MPVHPISSVLLRTTDAPAATAFYEAVLGHHGDAVYPLHENARARGARPHWIGRVDTDDPETLGGRLLADGGERLGPLPGGGYILRDPGGALLGIGAEPTPSAAGVVFHVLRTRDADAAAARYTAACGWAFEAPGPDGYRTFAWRAGGVAVGALAGVEHEPHVHPQWLYFFGGGVGRRGRRHRPRARRDPAAARRARRAAVRGGRRSPGSRVRADGALTPDVARGRRAAPSIA
jgi:predicted enzyme related to lactoylglutathione lyase